MSISIATKTTLLTILLAALLLPGVNLAEENPRPTVETGRLLPALDGSEPAAVFSPPPTTTQLWREGLADILARRDAAMADLKAELAEARGPERMQVEKRLQARKLDFEIEVLELQLVLDQQHQPAQVSPQREEARQRVAAEIRAARAFRNALGVTESQSDEAAEAGGEAR